MKRRVLGYVTVVVAVVCLCAAPSFAADNFNANKVGFGYQGIVAGNLLNGVSVRGWIGNNFGLEGNVFYGNATISPEGSSDMSAYVALGEAKLMYAFLVRPNSRFYAGAKFAYGHLDVSADSDTVAKGDMYIPGVLLGAEWCFPQLPEVGFNFEVGYDYMLNKLSSGGDDVDVKLHGMNVGFGIHYYF